MTSLNSVWLEFLRPGPTHNQLLSRLTPYLAVCDSRPAATFSLPFDHWEMEQALSALSYPDVGPVQNSVREAQILQVSDSLGQVLGSVPTLLAAVAQSNRQDPTQLTHLRLLLSASELSLLPFEMSTAPQGFPGERHHLLLQPVLPITMTRELRRSPTTPVHWQRPVRILFIAAAPEGLPDVPFERHLLALTRAVQPLLSASPALLRPEAVRQMITVLRNPSLADIRRACEEDDFTHVHILAHGESYKLAGQTRFGIALCEIGTLQKHVVDGARLADALRPQRSAGRGLAVPTMVTLMTCESDRQGSVLVPGGSLAHELHEAGIPWVIASQFPLSKPGSVLIADELYSRLLLGEDPRVVLYALRKRLFTDCPDTHDWASLVVYASLPADFDRQVRAFRRLQADRAMDHIFRRIDHILFESDRRRDQSRMSEADAVELGHLMPQIARYRALVEYAAPTGSSPVDADEQAEVWGLLGSMDRNLAEIQQYMHPKGTEWRRTMRRARRNYLMAASRSLNSPRYSLHYLSVSSLMGKGLPRRWWTIAKSAAHTFLKRDRLAWAHASMVELALLSLLPAATHGEATGGVGKDAAAPASADPESLAGRRKRAVNQAHTCAEKLAEQSPDGPATKKLLRQLTRYRRHIQSLSPQDKQANELFHRTLEEVLGILQPQ